MSIATAAAQDTLEQYDKMLWRLVWDHHRFAGGDLEDLKGEANVAFAEAYTSYSPAYGASFTTWLWWSVATRLQSHRRRSLRNDRRESEVIPEDVPTKQRFDVQMWLKELSPKSRLVAELTIDPPADIRHSLANRPRMTNAGQWMRQSLHNFLHDLGWSTMSIIESFHEIGEALPT